MKLFYIKLTLLLFLVNSCNSIVSNDVPLDTEFDLKLDEKAVVGDGGLMLTFKNVTEDSSCPEDVACIWAGNASLQFSSPGKNTSVLNTSVDPRNFEIDEFKITLISLSPYPNTKKKISKENYKARLLITKNSPSLTSSIPDYKID